MRELQPHTKDRLEVQAEAEKKRELKLLGTVKPQAGHKLWQYNTVTGELTEAEYEQVNIDFVAATKGEIASHRRVIVKDGCRYMLALNKKNAKRKLGINTEKK